MPSKGRRSLRHVLRAPSWELLWLRAATWALVASSGSLEPMEEARPYGSWEALQECVANS